MYFQEGGDGGFIGILAALAAFLGGLFGFFSSDAAWLKQAFVKLGEFLSDAFHRIVDFLSLLWEKITDLLKRAVDELKQLARDLGDFLGTLLRALHKLRDWIDLLYTKYIRRILILIQRARQVLVYLRLFHIGFAAKLDKYLAQLHADITRPLLIIRGTVNAVLDVLGNIVDPRGVLMSGPLLWRVWQDLGKLAGMFHLNGMSGTTPANPAQRAYYGAFLTTPAIAQRAVANARGVMDPEQQALKAEMDAALHG